MSFDGFSTQIEANFAKMQADFAGIEGRLRVIKSAPWRLIRNRRLLTQNWAALRDNDRLRAENWLLLDARWRCISSAHRA